MSVNGETSSNKKMIAVVLNILENKILVRKCASWSSPLPPRRWSLAVAEECLAYDDECTPDAILGAFSDSAWVSVLLSITILGAHFFCAGESDRAGHF